MEIHSERSVSAPKPFQELGWNLEFITKRQDLDVIGKAKYAFNEALIITKICHSLRALGATGKR